MTTKAMPIATTEEASDSVGPGDTMDGSSGISATSTDNAASGIDDYDTNEHVISVK